MNMMGFRTILLCGILFFFGACEREELARANDLGQTQNYQDWKIQFSLGKEWALKGQWGDLRAYFASPDYFDGGLFTSPGFYQSPQEAYNGAGAVLNALGLQLAGNVTTHEGSQGNMRTFKAEAPLISMRGEYKAALKVLFTSFQTSVTFLVIARPEKFAAYNQAADEAMMSTLANSPEVNQTAIQNIQGSYVSYSGNYDHSNSGSTSTGTDTTLNFYPNGTFEWSSQSSLSVSSTSMDHVSGSVFSNMGQRKFGQFTIIGNTIAFMADGTSYSFPLTLFSNGIDIGGKKFGRN